VRNKDWENWQNTMHVEPQAPAGSTGANRAPVVRPRPGHADLAGALKYDHDDIRDVLERASARETAARVAAGAVRSAAVARRGLRHHQPHHRHRRRRSPAGHAVSFDAARALAAGSAAALRRRRDRKADDEPRSMRPRKPATPSAARSR
jgi:hypothetical protein